MWRLLRNVRSAHTYQLNGHERGRGNAINPVPIPFTNHVCLKMATKCTLSESEAKLSESGQKKSRRLQKFCEHYTVAYPVLKESSRGEGYAHCTVCETDFSIGHGGINDCAIHVGGPRHKKYAASKQSQPSITFQKVSSEKEDLNHKVTSAELMFTNFLVEHNVSLISLRPCSQAL